MDIDLKSSTRVAHGVEPRPCLLAALDPADSSASSASYASYVMSHAPGQATKLALYCTPKRLSLTLVFPELLLAS